MSQPIPDSPKSPKEALKRYLLLIIKICVSLALIWYLAKQVDIGLLWQRLQNIKPAYLALALFLIASQTVILTLRWRQIIAALVALLPFILLLRIAFIGHFFNQALPGAIGGDALRVWRLYRSGVAVGTAFNSVVIDRLVALFSLLLFVLFSMPWLFSIWTDHWLRWGVVSTIGLGFLGFLVFFALLRLPYKIRHLKLVASLINTIADARTVVRNKSLILILIGLSLGQHLLTGTGVFILARALQLEVSLLACVLLTPPTLLVTMLPIALAGWGVREMAMITAFSYVGLASDDALLLSVTFGLAVIIAGLPGGVLWYFRNDGSHYKNSNVPST